ncbi:MAG: hypothetical protein O7G85_02560 [Planctomycetota bacterium]|nr:hypothetical protein [Planctomycetota bacterium]
MQTLIDDLQLDSDGDESAPHTSTIASSIVIVGHGFSALVTQGPPD